MLYAWSAQEKRAFAQCKRQVSPRLHSERQKAIMLHAEASLVCDVHVHSVLGTIKQLKNPKREPLVSLPEPHPALGWHTAAARAQPFFHRCSLSVPGQIPASSFQAAAALVAPPFISPMPEARRAVAQAPVTQGSMGPPCRDERQVSKHWDSMQL